MIVIYCIKKDRILYNEEIIINCGFSSGKKDNKIFAGRIYKVA